MRLRFPAVVYPAYPAETDLGASFAKAASRLRAACLATVASGTTSLLLAHVVGVADGDRWGPWAAQICAPVDAVTSPAPESAAVHPRDVFARFAPSVRVREDGNFVSVESNSMPDHVMMVGITAWQQQVPLPQRYKGANAWRIPLRPVVAKVPLSAKSHFFKGAIALAANGVPIFNPIKTNGHTDTFLAGELDRFGGHCGRADDYHYHIAPLHLQAVLGPELPVAYALDGYAIYGLTEPDGSVAQGLDAFNGHETAALGYHYHASKTYPYVNGGFHGEVVERDGQVDPQPRTNGVRPALPPLPGAKITGFNQQNGKEFSVRYEFRGETRAVNYSLRDDGGVVFRFVGAQGDVKTETYAPNARGGGEGRAREANGGARKTRAEEPRATAAPAGASGSAEAFAAPHSGKMVLTSPAFADGDPLPDEFNGNGAGATPPLVWRGAPEGTQRFALIMDHIDRDGVLKVYWTLYDIPASTTALPQNVHEIGRNGATWKREQSYVPPHSAGGAKQTYTIHLYALAAAPQFDAQSGPVTRDRLLAAIRGHVLDSAELRVTYQRPRDGAGAERGGKKERPRGEGNKTSANPENSKS